mgnify:CR=1
MGSFKEIFACDVTGAKMSFHVFQSVDEIKTMVEYFDFRIGLK